VYCYFPRSISITLFDLSDVDSILIRCHFIEDYIFMSVRYWYYFTLSFIKFFDILYRYRLHDVELTLLVYCSNWKTWYSQPTFIQFHSIRNSLKLAFTWIYFKTRKGWLNLLSANELLSLPFSITIIRQCFVCFVEICRSMSMSTLQRPNDRIDFNNLNRIKSFSFSIFAS